ncbi:hypothetical protein D5E69_10865 [Rossellomorea marisflavi]|uniref:hypothetical protein n=1 Tax=Rossellomorea marisflavi TaxID=189381 RepID=UPI001316078D|nr:hypothetical protein [Rossellomorea marisflavi]QHA36275.1 hypothetical protein D5E69_10865 [Rossellomorea marisflavi]
MDSAVIFDMKETFMREDGGQELWKEEAPELIHYLSERGYKIMVMNCPGIEQAKNYMKQLGLMGCVDGFYDRHASLPPELTDCSAGILVGGSKSKLSEMGCLTVCIGGTGSEDGADVLLTRSLELKAYLKAMREEVQYEGKGDAFHI